MIHFKSSAQGSLVEQADVNFDIPWLSEQSLVSSSVEVRYSLSSNVKTGLRFGHAAPPACGGQEEWG